MKDLIAIPILSELLNNDPSARLCHAKKARFHNAD
jgi:hypothetical protein